MLSFDEEGNGEPVRVEVPYTGGVSSGVPPESDQATDPISHSKGVEATGATFPSSAPFASTSIGMQGPVVPVDKSGPSVPSTGASAQGTAAQADVPRPSFPSNAGDQNATAKADIPGPSSAPTVGPRSSHKEPPEA